VTVLAALALATALAVAALMLGGVPALAGFAAGLAFDGVRRVVCHAT
jgi:hypothetical protein